MSDMDTQEYRYIEEDAMLLKPIYRNQEERRRVFEEIIAEIHHNDGQLFTTSSVTADELQHWMEVYEQTEDMFNQHCVAHTASEGDYEVTEPPDDVSLTEEEMMTAADILVHEHEENRIQRIEHLEKHSFNIVE